MNYLLGYLIIIISLLLNRILDLSASLTWIIGYIIIFLTAKSKNPLDPQVWLFCAWSILFVNYFSGVMYDPQTINYVQPILYISIELFLFHFAFIKSKSRNFKFNYNQISIFLSTRYTYSFQRIIAFFGILAIIGAISIAVDLFVLHNLSLNGGDRRAELHEMVYSPFTTIGMILLGGCYFSAVSLFFGGNKLNKLIGLLSMLSLAIASMCLAGKQGILICVLLMTFCLSMAKFYKVKLKMPIYLKISIAVVISIFSFYIITLSSERHENVDSGELFSESKILSKTFKKDMHLVPEPIKNTFAEIFGYYGNQLGTFSERWELDDYLNSYPLITIPPRVLNPFTWLERQIIKVSPIYNYIYPSIDYRRWVNSQVNGYFGLANWQTTNQQGILIFGTFGHLIVVFFHGYFSRRLYERVGSKITYSTFHMCIINNIFLVYTIMMNFLGETSAFFYLVIILFFYFKEKNNNKIREQFKLEPVILT